MAWKPDNFFRVLVYPHDLVLFGVVTFSFEYFVSLFGNTPTQFFGEAFVDVTLINGPTFLCESQPTISFSELVFQGFLNDDPNEVANLQRFTPIEVTFGTVLIVAFF